MISTKVYNKTPTQWRKFHLSGSGTKTLQEEETTRDDNDLDNH